MGGTILWRHIHWRAEAEAELNRVLDEVQLALCAASEDQTGLEEQLAGSRAQVVELELFPPALLSAKLSIPFGDGNGTAALLSAVEAALSNSIVGPVYVMTKDLVTGDSNAIYMKLLLTGATPDAQVRSACWWLCGPFDV